MGTASGDTPRGVDDGGAKGRGGASGVATADVKTPKISADAANATRVAVARKARQAVRGEAQMHVRARRATRSQWTGEKHAESDGSTPGGSPRGLAHMRVEALKTTVFTRGVYASVTHRLRVGYASVTHRLQTPGGFGEGEGAGDAREAEQPHG